MSHEQIVQLLNSYVIPFGTEEQMQNTIYRILDVAKVEWRPEYPLTKKDRIDVLCGGGVGIECKVDGGPSEVLEQLLRYAASDQINSLILVTRRSRQQFDVDTLGGKPFAVIWVATHL